MDLEDWEFLPVNGNHAMLDKTYFDQVQKSKENEFLDLPANSDSLFPDQLNSKLCQKEPEEETKEVICEKEVLSDHQEHQETIFSQVFFKKVKENDEFVDMKMDSPKSGDKVSSSPKIDGDFGVEDEEEAVEGKSFPGKNLRKWIGAVCSFGVAATICMIAIGSNQRSKQQINFKIYPDKKGKEVNHNAIKLNDAISALRGRGVQITRAHITVGGYCDGL